MALNEKSPEDLLKLAEPGGALELDGRRDSLPCLSSQSVVAHQLQELSTSELAAELYRRLCVGRLGEPGPFKGTMLDLYLARAFLRRLLGDAL